ncbi:unnamed protein product [Linum tenue]|uniref:Stress enhanced protein 1 n=1 Tax=Linum tenue TaxID=586396 RepID=A0AAV0RLW7_9ROSI|nr:unnamed protein product [Linum tenue]
MAAATSAVAAHLSPSLSLSVRDACPVGSTATLSVSRLPNSGFGRIGSTFATGSPLLISRTGLVKAKSARRAALVSVRSEQSTQDSGLDVWLGRIGMVGFAVAITVEISTGKGLLENFGLSGPMPTAALAVTGLVGVLTAVFIFQSSSKS